MSTTKKNIGFIFPGQGSQYPGMGKDFFEAFSEARLIFEEANDILKTDLTSLIFNGPQNELTQTKNSQPAIFVTSYAFHQVLQKQFPNITPFACAGLSLGEYTALTAAKKFDFAKTLQIVQKRGLFMHEACEKTTGTMAVILGLEDNDIINMVESLHMPNDIWAANFNCPKQVVISGTQLGIAKAKEAAEKLGAKRVLPLEVHGAFHSGLMKDAQIQLCPYLEKASINESAISLATNVTGTFIHEPQEIKNLLIQQVVSPTLWHKCITTMRDAGCELFIEIGCGKTLSGMNKRIDPNLKTISIEKIEDLSQIEREFN